VIGGLNQHNTLYHDPEAVQADMVSTLDASNAPTTEATYQTEVVSNKIPFATYTYKKVKASAGHHAMLDTDGTITKDLAKGLISINVVFTGSIKVHTWYRSFDTDYTEYSITTNTTHNISGNYFKIIALSETTISSINLTYSCTAASTKPRVVRTYVNWDFDLLNIGDNVPNVAVEGAGFAAYRKDTNNEVWVRSKDPTNWAAVYFGTPDPELGGEIFLKDFALISEVMLPSATASHGLTNDGGFPLLVGGSGRYDGALYFGGANSSFNLWKAGDTGNGPYATTQNNPDWGDRGSKVESLTLEQDVSYTITIAGKYQGLNNDNKEVFTIYVFVDNLLIVEKTDIPYMMGGFGLRGWQSAIEYNSIKITDFPLVCPDGIDHYNDVL